MNGLVVFNLDSGSDFVSGTIYSAVKSAYHFDVTHKDSGLECVRASSIQQAVDLIAMQFVKWIADDSSDRAKMITTDSAKFIQYQGYIKYGLAFIRRYKEVLSPHVHDSVLEILTQQEAFLEARVDHENVDSSNRMSKNVERMTWVVLALTIASIVLAFSTLIESGYGPSTVPLLLIADVVCLGLVSLVIYLLYRLSKGGRLV